MAEPPRKGTFFGNIVKAVTGKKTEKKENEAEERPREPARPATELMQLSTEISEEEEEAMKAAFEQCDENGDGVIDKKELRNLLKKHLKRRRPPTKKQLARIMKEVDLDGDGVISYKEFRVMIINRKRKQNVLLELFLVVDKNRDGYITRDELFETMSQVHDDVTDEEIDELMTVLDASKKF